MRCMHRARLGPEVFQIQTFGLKLTTASYYSPFISAYFGLASRASVQYQEYLFD